MTQQSYFRYSFLLPIGFPLVFIILGLSREGLSFLDDMTQEGRWSTWMIGSLLIGGLPYLIFLAGAYWMLRGKSVTVIKGFTLIAPILYSLVFVVLSPLLGLLYDLSTGSHSQLRFPGDIDGGILLVPFCLILGYFYVGVIFGTFLILKGFGVFTVLESAA